MNTGPEILTNRYDQLERARRFFIGCPDTLAEIDKQQASILKRLENQTRVKHEFVNHVSKRVALQNRLVEWGKLKK